MDYEGTVLVVSHDRYFLNNVCTHIVDIDYGKIKMYVGNYDFWYESSQLMQKLIKDQNKKAEQKIEELQSFISPLLRQQVQVPQATARRKLLDKLTVEEMPASCRRYPWVGFKADREPGKDRLFVTDVSKTVDGVKVLNNVSFIVGKEDKIAFVGDNELAVTLLFKILMGEEEPDSGTVKWGASTTQAYFPKDNTAISRTATDHHGLDAPVLRGQARELSAELPGPDALLRRRGVQAREGPLRRREGAVHDLQDDALRGQRAAARPADQPPRPGEHRRAQQRPGGVQVQRHLLQPRPPAHADRGQPHNRDHRRRQLIDRMCTYDEYMDLTGGTIPER